MIENINNTLDILIRSRYPIIWIETSEEVRATNAIRSVVESQNSTATNKKAVYEWTLTQGIVKYNSGTPEADTVIPVPDSYDPVAAIRKIAEIKESKIVILKDFHKVIAEPLVNRALRDASIAVKASATTIIIISPIIDIPIELQKAITVLSMPLPGADELASVMDWILDSSIGSAPEATAKKLKKVKAGLTNGFREQILGAAKGLTIDEAENVFAKSLIKTQKIDIKEIVSEKEQIIKKSGILEFFPNTSEMKDVGGLQALKTWTEKRKLAFSSKAKEFGLRTPRGVFLTGSPGTGKSLAAKAIAGHFEMPLLRLDVSRIFSGIVGSSEQNVSLALKMAEAVAPCVLWIDEVEKALAGAASSGQLDSGVTARVFGTLLTWMQEHKEPVFIVVTCNNPLTLPPEFMRRFDEVFFVDLPTEKERAEIFQIHITKQGRKSEAYDVSKYAAITEGYSGAEIENIVMAAMYNAFFNESELNDDQIIDAIHQQIPLSQKRKTDIDAMRAWGKANALTASAPEAQEQSRASRKLEFQS